MVLYSKSNVSVYPSVRGMLGKAWQKSQYYTHIFCHLYKILKGIGKIQKSLQKDHLGKLVHPVISKFINISKENMYKNLKSKTRPQDSCLQEEIVIQQKKIAGAALAKCWDKDCVPSNSTGFQCCVRRKLTVNNKPFNCRPSDYFSEHRSSARNLGSDYSSTADWDCGISCRVIRGRHSGVQEDNTLLSNGCETFIRRTFKYCVRALDSKTHLYKDGTLKEGALYKFFKYYKKLGKIILL